ncbi:alpha/beta fold hydrolase [Sphingomonas aurantiaca]|uniref:alpha/beta fold hydrolase n=1 Tax=Sphingomonas aurantiaca TaxID=185949 RepID=UPI002FE40F9F
MRPISSITRPSSSLLRWIAAQGFHAWLVDWGSPGDEDRDLDLTAHVERLLLPLLQVLPEPPVVVGHCLGGTLALGAAAVTPVAGVATIAAPWHFAGYADSRPTLAATWAAVKPAAALLGLLPMEVLQAGFWQLDLARTIAKYEAFADLALDSDAARAFVGLEDWANAGAPSPTPPPPACSRTASPTTAPASAAGPSPASRSTRTRSPARPSSSCRSVTVSCPPPPRSGLPTAAISVRGMSAWSSADPRARASGNRSPTGSPRSTDVHGVQT